MAIIIFRSACQLKSLHLLLLCEFWSLLSLRQPLGRAVSTVESKLVPEVAETKGTNHVSLGLDSCSTQDSPGGRQMSLLLIGPSTASFLLLPVTLLRSGVTLLHCPHHCVSPQSLRVASTCGYTWASLIPPWAPWSQQSCARAEKLCWGICLDNSAARRTMAGIAAGSTGPWPPAHAGLGNDFH